MKEHVRSSMLIKWWLIKLLIFCSVLTLKAQIRQLQNLEIPIGRNESMYSILPAGDEGLILHRPVRTGREYGLQVIHLDTLFKEKWSGIMPVNDNQQLAKTVKTREKCYFLFHHSEFREISFYLYEVDLATGDFTRYAIANYIPFLPIQLEITEYGALLGGYFGGRVPVVLFFEFSTTSSKVLPGLLNEPGELIQIKSNLDNSFNVLISARNMMKQKTLWIKNYDPQGRLVENATLIPEENNSLLFGRIIRLDENRQLIAGVYGNRNSEYSKGIFIADIYNTNNQQVLYYPFVDLENFFKYMKAKRENRVKERIARRKIKGKKLRFHYRFLVDEFVQHKDQYILLGEAFYPRYKQYEKNYMVATYGSLLVFDGYQYTHAVIIGFDKEGKLIWDNSFEINDIRSFTLEQFVKMDVQNDQIALLYLFDNKLRSKIIQNNSVVEGKSLRQLETNSTEETNEDEQNIGKLDYWYGHNFLAYGVKSNPFSRFTNQPRRIFFMSKVRYQ